MGVTCNARSPLTVTLSGWANERGSLKKRLSSAVDPTPEEIRLCPLCEPWRRAPGENSRHPNIMWTS